MKAIKTLIKLQKKELDARARIKAEWENHIEQLETQIAGLQSELEKERALLASNAQIAWMFVHYEEANRTRQQAIQQAIAQLRHKLKIIEEEMQIYFGELKKYEIALDRRKTEVEQKANRQETERLGDIALQRHHDNEKD